MDVSSLKAISMITCMSACAIFLLPEAMHQRYVFAVKEESEITAGNHD